MRYSKTKQTMKIHGELRAEKLEMALFGKVNRYHGEEIRTAYISLTWMGQGLSK